MRSIRRLAAALSFVAGLQAASAAEIPNVADQAQYERVHATAVAFAENLDAISNRYGPLPADLVAQARSVLAEAERAARQRRYAEAAQQAGNAYQLLRTAITTTIAKQASVRS
jgi:hypothetical protein